MTSNSKATKTQATTLDATRFIEAVEPLSKREDARLLDDLFRRPILAQLGKHKMGKSCLYVNKLADIDLDVLAKLVRAGLRDLDTTWKVQPS
ncbi:DUF1801 domain-containing protein [Aliiroseovarius sediminis]|uniref:DUF1801 domain-containing protein n=1 Tax=Aliiroseovarius sediminis TaxID=2925839 RepID=UPI001F5634FE|nr:DUF1801 domain-containing protein [Aliiroseovarius sediminis]MCI2394241.1 DUF1801 domain-containing protein [Aliiroseovarius sediminis]